MKTTTNKKAPTVFFSAFPDVIFPAALRDLGLTDESWGNDAFAKATKPLKDGKTLCVWVAEDDEDAREIPGSPKYMVVLYDDDFTDPSWTIADGCADLRNIVAQVQAVLFADALEDPDFRTHCLKALTEEYGTDEQIEALNLVGEYVQHALSPKEWDKFETYALKATDYEMVRAACIFLSTKGTAGVRL